MKIHYLASGLVAAAVLFGVSSASAQGKSGGHGGGSSSMSRDSGFVRADTVAGKHGERGRANARTRGSHAMGFCPPGQRKKSGQGSRFAC